MGLSLMFDAVYNTLKITIIIAIAAAFMIVITNLINIIGDLVFGGVIGEILGIISVCLPFDASAVFGSIITAITGIGSFMVGHKIYALTSSFINL